MKSLNRFRSLLLIVLFVPALTFSQGNGWGSRAIQFLSSLDLSEEQMETIRPLHFDLEKKLIGLNERITLSRVELRELMHPKSLDQSKIAQKMGQISQLCLEKKTLRLDNWFEIQEILTPEQQKKWKQALQMRMAGKARPRGVFSRGSMGRGREKVRERRSWNRFE